MTWGPAGRAERPAITARRLNVSAALCKVSPRRATKPPGHHDDGLDTRREEQDDQRDRYRPDAVPTPFQGLVQRVFGVVRVRSDHAPERTQKTAVTVRMVAMTVSLLVVVAVWEFRHIAVGSHCFSFVPTPSVCTLRIGRMCDVLRVPHIAAGTGCHPLRHHGDRSTQRGRW